MELCEAFTSGDRAAMGEDRQANAAEVVVIIEAENGCRKQAAVAAMAKRCGGPSSYAPRS